MKLLDANIFIYAEGGEHPYRDPCREILNEARGDRAEYAVDVELVQELLDFYGRRKQADRALAAARSTFKLFPDPFPITRDEIERAMQLLTPKSRLSPRDAIHAGVCLNFELEGIVSADKAFDHVPGVTRFDPIEDLEDLEDLEDRRSVLEARKESPEEHVSWEEVKRKAGLEETPSKESGE